MAIVDSLLKLVGVRNADGLVLQSGQVPWLDLQGQQVGLSMPVPTPDTIEAILEEVASDEQRVQLRQGGSLCTTYCAVDGTGYAVQVERVDDGVRMAFRAGSARAAESSAPAVAAGLDGSAEAATDRPSDPTSAHAIERLLQRAQAAGASDLFVSSADGVRIRVGGTLQELETARWSEEQLLAYLRPAMSPADEVALAEDGSCDLGVDLRDGGGYRYRVNLFRQQRGLSAAFRPIKPEVPTLEALNLPGDLRELVKLRSGLVLLVGTAGSGKSTTLVALIEHLNRTAAKHVITLEDPIEYSYTPARSLIHQREVGVHVRDFATGLRAALRESPDVILLGEMRDPHTIAAALTAAETGHLVLSTLHSGSPSMAIHRMVDSFPEHQQLQVRHQLADVLRVVVSQILLPSSRPPLRVPAYDKLVVTAAVSTKIRENRCHQIETELQKGRADGMVPLERSLATLVGRSLLSFSAAREVARDPLLLEQMVQQQRGQG